MRGIRSSPGDRRGELSTDTSRGPPAGGAAQQSIRMLNRFAVDERVLTRAEVLGLGYTAWELRLAVRSGAIIRLRRDRYIAVPDALSDVAVRVGGRLSCVSLLAALGVFVRDSAGVHVRVAPNASRLRVPTVRDAVHLHWGRMVDQSCARHQVSLVDAVRDAVRCQAPRDMVATLDSLLCLGLSSFADLREVFATLPARYGVLLRLVDGRAESGTETLVRLMLRQLGVRVELHMNIDGVGRVDLLVDGWLIIECDSKRFHEGWDTQRADRRRDLAAVRAGYVPVRLLAEDVLFRPNDVREALADIVARGRA